MKYTQKKFTSFNFQKQQKIINEFIKEIHNKWDDKEKQNLVKEFEKCLNWLGVPISIDLKKATIRQFLEFAVPLERRLGQELTDPEILKKDGLREQKQKQPLYLILDNLRSSFNVGSIFRTAECFGVKQILVCGYTATPNNEKVQKTAMGTTEFVDWQHFEKTEKAIQFLREKNITIFALETTVNAKYIGKINFTKPAALLLGNEALGISEETLELADETVSIPLSGWKNSLNVGVTAAIACYEAIRQWDE
ncbi:MAG: RNA methyltransferase [Candidatus Cloacimonetes bacterium]|nr:RNA methyltransferase [Candidatus Cloacimonadota bacterium]MCF7814324.1 RNA methyltransferase [Candidatus Cloacimonadota bacterium]MCF7868984.1 RNA methyltransferase [Candidatus Cloacimonadota bacterium]MCF7884378.1 RNA methyltransferase [Candidatus Cloacimonadota bacterium]